MSAWLFSVPVLFRLLISLGIILLLSQYTRKLCVALVIGTTVLAYWCGHSTTDILHIVTARLFSSQMAFLILIILLIIWLSSQMAACGMMSELVRAVRSRVSHRFSLAALPAIIGFLPMPGGALFSAPMVDQCDENNSIDPKIKTSINYWFRHVWEYWLPLYPGVILAIELSHISLPLFILVQFPMTIISLLVGWFFFLRRIDPAPKQSTPDTQFPRVTLLLLAAPVVIIVGVYILFTISARILDIAYITNNAYIPVVSGVIIAICYLQYTRPLSKKQWYTIFTAKKAFALVLVVIAVRVYGAFITANMPDGIPLVAHIRADMNNWGIPAIAIIMLVPFVCGITTGLSIGFVGAGFPVIINLPGPAAPLPILIATIILGYTCGYIGIILSPVHICLIVTTEHFKTRLLHNLTTLILPSAVVISCAVCIYALILYFHAL
jgi:uncharacterized protein